MSKLKKIRYRFEKYGLSVTLFLLTEKLFDKIGIYIPYKYWIGYWESRATDLLKSYITSGSLKKRPFFSVIIMDYSGNQGELRSCVKSVSEQIYSRWEIHVISKEFTFQESGIDKSVRFHSSRYLSDGLNVALAEARGEFVLFLDSEWLMSPQCLLNFAALLDRDPLVDVLYSDHDNIDVTGRRFDPAFKPKWCPDSYFSGVFSIFPLVCRTDVVRSMNGFYREFDSCFEWDFGLRITETTERIERVPAVLFHRRRNEKEYLLSSVNDTFEVSIAHLEGSLERRGHKASVNPVEGCPGKFLIRYQCTDPERVSIIIPTRDSHRELDNCLESIFAKSKYMDFEIVLIDNNSRRPETTRVIEKWKRQKSEIFRVFSYEGAFNYSMVNNFGVENASGRYLLFLNDDTEIISVDWIEAMVEYAQQTSIGAVGALLLYPNGRVQHAGVVLGIGSCTGHVFRYFGEHDRGYCCRLQTVNNYSAVTGACLMCRREVFERAGGFDENLEVSFGDVDICLKLLELGYRNVYLPHVKLYHHESLSRGKDDTEEKLRRTDQEIAYLRSRWRKYIDDDPCYNPNLTRQYTDFSIRVDDVPIEPYLFPRRKAKL